MSDEIKEEETQSQEVNIESQDSDNPKEKIGMLILDVKGNYATQIQKYAREFHRENDLIFIEKKPYPIVRVPIFICIYYSRLFKL